MAAVHCHGMSRHCGATTTVTGQSSVFVDGVLVAVEGDPETHGAGNLISSSPGTVTVAGLKMIVITDTASADNADHTPSQTDPSQGSSVVSAY